MSELIQKNDDRATVRWKLLTGVSGLALAIYASSASIAEADDVDHPQLWVEFGGQAEMVQGTSSPFTAPFMFPTVPPEYNVYGKKSFAQKQEAPRFSFGGNSKITFQPDDSDWVFSASIRYGRSHGNGHTHYQGPQIYHVLAVPVPKYAAAFSDTLVRHDERHAIVDFMAGKDVGLGAFGHSGTSTISLGVRFSQFTGKTNATIYARPNADVVGNAATFHQYALTGHASRSFKGVGPSLSWNASAALAGSPDHSQIMLDWGIDGAVLFGRQKTKTEHATSAYHFSGKKPKGQRNIVLYTFGTHSYHSTRSRRVTVPDFSAFAAISFRLPHSKVSFGYRAEILMDAFDRGIDARNSSNLTFNGPYASISIGLGD